MAPVYIRINPEEFTEPLFIGEQRFDPGSLAFREKIEMLAEAARSASGSHEVIPILQTDSLTDADIDTAADVLSENGFKKICLQQ